MATKVRAPHEATTVLNESQAPSRTLPNLVHNSRIRKHGSTKHAQTKSTSRGEQAKFMHIKEGKSEEMDGGKGGPARMIRGSDGEGLSLAGKGTGSAEERD
jgi:hypothetical protein